MQNMGSYSVLLPYQILNAPFLGNEEELFLGVIKI